jgi:hypothetical protein
MARRGEARREPHVGPLHNLHQKTPRKGINVESFVMRMSETETTGTMRAPTSNVENRSADCAPPAVKLAITARRAQSPWPFNLGDVTPLEWWRTMPADYLDSGQRVHLRATLETICVMKDRQWLSALRGDAAASIAIAIGAMPVDQVTLEVDLAMSALALCALEGSDGAALVLSHILRRTALDHPFGKDISASWLAHNLCRALTAKSHRSKPRRRSKTSNAASPRHAPACTPVLA